MSYSDVDSDKLIDILDYIGGDISASEFDHEMKASKKLRGIDVDQNIREIQLGWSTS
ncbi:MAG: hypothetical protein GJ680_18580 [Alteromonadaceae bacterium]|nr:hypothetical protein [Alteromonadaceae bacterium]